MRLQGQAARIDPATAERVNGYVDTLDKVISNIRTSITDNGRGLGTSTRSSGLARMRRRAENNGGTFQATAPATGGTRLTWTARPRH
jgi:signal transduction histidine kinase